MFKREVAETFLRCKQQGFDQDNAVIELNSLKIASAASKSEVICASTSCEAASKQRPSSSPHPNMLISPCPMLARQHSW
jgi:hypothetical protein